MSNDDFECMFELLHGIYTSIATRQSESACFLQRNLRYVQRYGHRSPKEESSTFSVRYTWAHSAVSWTVVVQEPRCLWCRNLRNVRFANATQLMEHLRTCHGKLNCVLDSANLHMAGTVPATTIIVELKLLAESQEIFEARAHKLPRLGEEVYVNAKRYPRYCQRENGDPDPNEWMRTLPWKEVRTDATKVCGALCQCCRKRRNLSAGMGNRTRARVTALPEYQDFVKQEDSSKMRLRSS